LHRDANLSENNNFNDFEKLLQQITAHFTIHISQCRSNIPTNGQSNACTRIENSLKLITVAYCALLDIRRAIESVQGANPIGERNRFKSNKE
jgi:hypothetical protein